MDLDDVTAALRGLAVPDGYREPAIRNLVAWWQDPQYAAYRPQIESLARRGQWHLLLDSFYRTVPFGTGGRRGPVGIGPNRINQHTITTYVQGHANYLRRRVPAARLRVVVAFDVRVFRDLRGLYDDAVPNPLLGRSSRDFARLAAGVYAANGIEVYTVPGDGDFFLSTPELSFAIRALDAHGGLNISASHNHPDDNGAKIYMPSGGQPVPPDDEDLAREVEAVAEVAPADFDAALGTGWVQWWDAALHERYLQANLSRSIDPGARRARIVYTPLHGTGRHTVGDVLPRAGFDMRFVERQLAADGAFPAVKFRAPNPEVPESMELVTAEAQAQHADIGLATDPDADRLGVVLPEDGQWRSLTGNEIAVVLAAYIIETRRALGTLPPRAFMIKTLVTTELLTRMARANGVQMIGNLLVGFKYVGQVLDAIAAHGHFGDVRATLEDFVFAAEESNGVLVSSELRDKDAAGGALLLAELCARLRQRGDTLAGYLTDVYRRYGYAASVGTSLVMEGIAGLEQLQRMMQQLRAAPPQTLEGRALQRRLDYWSQEDFGPFRSETDRSSRNVLQLQYEGELRVSVRPSGTEPKIKIYVEQLFDPSPDWAGAGLAVARREMDAAAQRLGLSVVDGLLALIEVHLPHSGLIVSPLVSLDHRIDFTRRFLPELEARVRGAGAGDADQMAAWIEARLQAYGTDPRYLVAAGVASHLGDHPLPADQDRLVRRLFFLD